MDAIAKGQRSASAQLSVVDRYEVLGPLGRGGMAEAYRVVDPLTGQELALKRLLRTDTTNVELFEREFHTLMQLAHPRIVRAYDYGFGEDGHPYYTMELLDGGDLRELAPLPWQQACSIAYDVCSALSLLHSRRLVHRDLTPRNVRCTADGTAKLLDFGLLDAFGPPSVLAGTPPYVAPELVHQVSLDARSDLFSLGATLYYALTGRVAFPATRFEDLRDIWRTTPGSPLQHVPELPRALDQLVMALLRVDAGSRPRSAAEVMDRLAPLLPRPADESLAVTGAYLAAPQEVGRTDVRQHVRAQLLAARRGRGGGVLFVGEAGTGRTRTLDGFVLDAKVIGAVVARAGASDGARGALGVAQAIVRQVHAAVPTLSLEAANRDARTRSVLLGDGNAQQDGSALRDVSRPGLSRADVQAALATWLSAITRRRLVALAIDDLELVDEPSAALVAALAIDAGAHRLAYAVTLRSESLQGPTPAVEVLREHARSWELSPLDAAQVRELLAGVFGEVPNLEGLSKQLHDLSGGRPRECMLLAQNLVDQGVVTYAGGTFRLPVSVDAAALPAGLEGALDAQIAALSATAREVGCLLALAVTEHLSRAELAGIEGIGASRLDPAVAELRAIQALAGTPDGYRLCHPMIARKLLASASAHDLRRWHSSLAVVHRTAGFGVVAESYHALRGQDPGAAFKRLLEHSTTAEDRTVIVFKAYDEIGIARTCDAYRAALNVCEEVGAARDRLLLWPALTGVAAAGGDPASYDLAAPAWLACLLDLTGYHDWHALPADLEPADRAIQAFVKASERHAAVPEAERSFAPADAIKELVVYVVFTIAVAARTLRVELIRGLPDLLEPFAPLNPLVHAMRLNAQVSWTQAQGYRVRGRRDAIALLEVIDALDPDLQTLMAKIRAAVCQSIATNEAALGIQREDPERWLQTSDPLQRVGAEYVKKVMALHRGDWKAAEAHRRQAELLLLQNDTKVMFSTLSEELEVHALARDLTGLRDVRVRLHDVAQQLPNWGPVAEIADAYYQYLRGDAEAMPRIAAQLRREAEEGPRPHHRMLPLIEAATIELLLERGETQAALAFAREAIDACETRGYAHAARLLAPVVALAEAENGAYAEARRRIEAALEAQRELGVSGLLAGRCHEYLARCAIAVGDDAGFHAAAHATAEHYRPGESEVLGALHERLMEHARRMGLIEQGPVATVDADDEELTALVSHLHTTFLGCVDARERAEAALRLLRDLSGAQVGHLYLLTEAGLTLSASTGMEPGAAPELLAHARDQLELEQDADIRTMTAGLENASEDANQSTLYDAEGNSLHALSLATRRNEGLMLVGVALLGGSKRDRRVGLLCGVMAAQLIESGGYQPVTIG